MDTSPDTPSVLPDEYTRPQLVEWRKHGRSLSFK